MPRTRGYQRRLRRFPIKGDRSETMIKIMVAAILTVALAGGVLLFNRLVRLRNTLRASWSDIDVMLKKRHDLVPNLVEAVKGYASHEKGTLSRVTEARTKAMRAEGPTDKAREENTFTETLKSLFALVEGYPDLKADASFLELQTQLVEIENGIEYARRYYNAVVRDYNSMTEVFPSNLVASGFGFTREKFFALSSPEERDRVDVSIS
jgi:LemA protein